MSGIIIKRVNKRLARILSHHQLLATSVVKHQTPFMQKFNVNLKYDLFFHYRKGMAMSDILEKI